MAEILITHDVSADASELRRPRDDLDVALDALREDGHNRVALGASGLTDATASTSVASPRDLAIYGCRRVAELVHNEQRHKLEAAMRGAVPLVAALYERHAGAAEVEIHACRALRALCFRNDVSRQLVSETPAISALVALIRRSIDELEPAQATSIRPESRIVDTAIVLSVTDESLTTLTLLVHRHPVNHELALGAGALDQVARAASALSQTSEVAHAESISQPPTSPPAPASGTSTRQTSAPMPADVARKAAMLHMILSP